MIVKFGFTAVYIIFLVLLYNIDYGHSFEPPHCVPTIYVLSKSKKNITFYSKIKSFAAVRISVRVLKHNTFYLTITCF